MSQLILSSAPPGTESGSPWWTIASILVLCAVGVIYGIGLQELWLRRGRRDVIVLWRAMAFAAGLAACAAAVTGPVHSMAETSLAGHMIQHMLLLVVAGPLLAAGGAGLPMSLALPQAVRKRLNRIRGHPGARWLRRPTNLALVGALAFTAALWLWHMPAPYLLALHHPAVHAIEHMSFLGMSWMLCSAVLTPARHRLTGPLGFLLLFVVGMTGAALGAVLTFAPAPLYPPEVYGGAGDALIDQQLAGLIMWIPMDVLVLAMAVGIFARWLRGLELSHPAHGQRNAPIPVGKGVS